MKKISTLIASTFVIATILSGCSSTPDHYTDANFDDLKVDVSTTICSVSGKRVIEKKDITSFKELAARLNGYEGSRETKMKELSKTLRITAENWEVAEGKDLGEGNAKTMTALCEKIKSS